MAALCTMTVANALEKSNSQNTKYLLFKKGKSNHHHSQKGKKPTIPKPNNPTKTQPKQKKKKRTTEKPHKQHKKTPQQKP